MPAPASAWPTLALMPPTASGPATESSRDSSTAETSEPASIGSPSDVPVPCASFSMNPAVPGRWVLLDSLNGHPVAARCHTCAIHQIR
eukprot:6617530-Prymnesium_polylepis.1